MTEKEALILIAQGYYDECKEDRYIRLHNPKYRDGTLDGEAEDPYIVYDIMKGRLI
jgi:hypothetical protein